MKLVKISFLGHVNPLKWIKVCTDCIIGLSKITQSPRGYIPNIHRHIHPIISPLIGGGNIFPGEKVNNKLIDIGKSHQAGISQGQSFSLYCNNHIIRINPWYDFNVDCSGDFVYLAQSDLYL